MIKNLNAVGTPCLELERTRHRDRTRRLTKIMKTKTKAVDPVKNYQLLGSLLLRPWTAVPLNASDVGRFFAELNRHQRRKSPQICSGLSRVPDKEMLVDKLAVAPQGFIQTRGGSWLILVGVDPLKDLDGPLQPVVVPLVQVFFSSSVSHVRRKTMLTQ